MKGKEPSGAIERRLLVRTLIELAARGGEVVGPKEIPPRPPAPRFRTDIYAGPVAMLARVGRGFGAAFAIAHTPTAATNVILLQADVRLAYVGEYSTGTTSGGIRVRILGPLYGCVGLGLGVTTGTHGELALPAYSELGVDVFREETVGFSLSTRLDYALDQGPPDISLAGNETHPPRPLPRSSHGPFLGIGVMVRF